MLSFTY